MKKMAPTTYGSVTARTGSRAAYRPAGSVVDSSSLRHGVTVSGIGHSHQGGDRRQAMASSSGRRPSLGNSSSSNSSSSSSSSSASSRTSRKSSSAIMNKVARASGKKSVYKHVPHALKPVHLVAKRNARERRRVQAVNSAFLRLRKHVPYEPRHKRLSKVKTLRVAITYISHLQEMIRDHDRRLSSRPHHHQHHHLNILAEAAAADVPSINDNVNNEVNVFNNGYQFLNGSCAEDGGPGHPRTIALHHHGLSSSSSPLSSSSSSSSSHFLHPPSHGPLHVPLHVDGLNGTWSENLQYVDPMEQTKMSTCAESPAYFTPTCPPQQYDVTANNSYLPYDTFSVQIPYQLLR